MSASLVGSEMCIRDRLSKQSASSGRPSIGAATRGPVPQARSLDRSAAAVSYTHLTLPTICSV
eukprot:14110586-Alexandrium_andersonii.AAC.1